MNTIETVSGRLVNPLALGPEDIRFPDITNALSNICRFGGHVRRFYSVADHLYYGAVLLAAYVIERKPDTTSEAFRTLLFEWLFHDLHEAYCGDIPAPLKAEFYVESVPRELALQRVVTRHFRRVYGVPEHLGEAAAPLVDMVDKQVMLPIEHYALRTTGDDAPAVLWDDYARLPEVDAVARRLRLTASNPTAGLRLARAFDVAESLSRDCGTGKQQATEFLRRMHLHEYPYGHSGVSRDELYARVV